MWIKDMLRPYYRNYFGAVKETLWAEIFHDTIKNSTWLTDQSFSLGRWAVGYEFAYVLYRVLNSAKPKNILELGLGQTTSIISQYVSAHEDVSHTVVEHDDKWIDFYLQEKSVTQRTNILNLELETATFRNSEVLVYKNFSENVGDRKYDLICIDGPFGMEKGLYSRIDILSIIPHCLDSNFVIMLDDYNRKPEQRLVSEIKKVLETEKIHPIFSASYVGAKESHIITTEDQKFLCSL